MLTLKVGDMAYWDALSGLVACRVTRIIGPSGQPSTAQRIEFVVTARTHRLYRCGWTNEAHGFRVVPRAAIHRRAYATWIIPYTIDAGA
jgi:hypothetical protein